MSPESVSSSPQQGKKSLGEQLVGAVANELNVANVLSASRPALTALATRRGLERRWQFAGLIGLAFLTDVLDGAAARRFGGSNYGDMVDIFGDRATEFILFKYRTYAFNHLN